MTSKDWNPEQYLKFANQRTQPSIDLVTRIECKNPRKIIDIGCGPGNSTQILVNKWPDAKIIGVDKSLTMIKKATKDFQEQEWLVKDAGLDNFGRNYDIVFSNAAIQWIPNHQHLLKKFYKSLNQHGILAVQIPLFWDMPLGKAIAHIAENGPWNSKTKDVKALFTIHTSSFYYDVLSDMFESIELWQTDYYHIMDSHAAILEMIRSTGLKPYLEKLASTKEIEQFEQLVLAALKSDYPQQLNDKVLFPFKRLFFIAQK